jgi:hypothetical protein
MLLLLSNPRNFFLMPRRSRKRQKQRPEAAPPPSQIVMPGWLQKLVAVACLFSLSNGATQNLNPSQNLNLKKCRQRSLLHPKNRLLLSPLSLRSQSRCHPQKRKSQQGNHPPLSRKCARSHSCWSLPRRQKNHQKPSFPHNNPLKLRVGGRTKWRPRDDSNVRPTV